uniref:Uncharacterized protein n=1 Tax=Setaria italica TaxID=4555 RepID=A0A0Q3QG89_SETIT
SQSGLLPLHITPHLPMLSPPLSHPRNNLIVVSVISMTPSLP